MFELAESGEPTALAVKDAAELELAVAVVTTLPAVLVTVAVLDVTAPEIVRVA